jgi:hypothetical protein
MEEKKGLLSVNLIDGRKESPTIRQIDGTTISSVIAQTIDGIDAVMNQSIDRIHLMLAVALDGSIPPGALTTGPTS